MMRRSLALLVLLVVALSLCLAVSRAQLQTEAIDEDISQLQADGLYTMAADDFDDAKFDHAATAEPAEGDDLVWINAHTGEKLTAEEIEDVMNSWEHDSDEGDDVDMSEASAMHEVAQSAREEPKAEEQEAVRGKTKRMEKVKRSPSMTRVPMRQRMMREEESAMPLGFDLGLGIGYGLPLGLQMSAMEQMKMQMMMMKVLKMVAALKASKEEGKKIVYKGEILPAKALRLYLMKSMLEKPALLKAFMKLMVTPESPMADSILGLKMKLGRAMLLLAPNEQKTNLHLHSDRAVVNVGTVLNKVRSSTLDDRDTITVGMPSMPSMMMRGPRMTGIPRHEEGFLRGGPRFGCVIRFGRMICPHRSMPIMRENSMQ